MARALKTIRVSVGAGLRSLGTDAAVRGVDGFEEAWDLASAIPGWFTRENAAAFWGVISDTKPTTIVEVGSYQGRSTTLLALALQNLAPGGTVVSIDPHTGDRQQLERLNATELPTETLLRLHTAGAGIEDVLDIRVATSSEVAASWSGPGVDLLFIDGWHSYEAVIGDADAWIPKLASDGIVCFDDFGNYDEVANAVRESCAKYNLHMYGSVVAQAWAGRCEVPPHLKSSIHWLGRMR